jgi:hypothetical protein
MNRRQKIFLIPLAMLGFAAAALWIFSLNLAAGHLEVVQKELSRLLGLDVRFADLQVHLLGRLGFSAKDLRIADDPRFAATPILRSREIIIGIKFWSLLHGRLVVDSLILQEPEFQIITDESGLRNLEQLSRTRKEPFSLSHPIPGKSNEQSVSFAVDTLRIQKGRIIYLDRSFKEPAELQLGDIDLTLGGLEQNGNIKLRLAAALAEGLGQDLHIDGEFSAAPEAQSLIQREMNLAVRFDALHLPVVARAIAALRDKIPREIEITGPMSLKARAVGTLAQPRFEDIVLQAPVFGSSDYNVKLTGDIKFSAQRSWEDAELDGAVALNPLPLQSLRNLNWFRQYFSPALVTEGAVGVYVRFQGRWNDLRIGALVRADRSEWKYRDWFRKDLYRRAEIKARVARRKDKFFFHESEIVSDANRIGFLGFIDVGTQPKLQLRLYSRQGDLRDWREMIFPTFFAGASGRTDFSVVIDRNLLPEDDRWSAQGHFRLTGGAVKSAHGGRAIEDATGTVVFAGRQAQLEGGQFRVGGANFVLDGAIADILDPSARYQLSSHRINLADLNLLAFGPPMQLDDFSARGAARFYHGALMLDGTAQSPRGRIADVDYKDLRSEILWSADGMTLKNLSLGIFEGKLKADGFVSSSSQTPGQFELSAKAEDIPLRALAMRFLPGAHERLEGRLFGSGRFTSASAESTKGQNAITGSGEALAQNGLIKDFNLISQLLLRGSDAVLSGQMSDRLPPGFIKLLTRRDTPYESLKADFILEPGRIRSDNLVITTPDYTVTGAGWVGFDRTTKWNGLIVLSPRLTQEIQRDLRLLRYLLDRRGRLAATFRIDGTIPTVKIRLDNRALAQTLRGGTAGRDGEREMAEPSQNSGSGKKWLPNALEKFLNR